MRAGIVASSSDCVWKAAVTPLVPNADWRGGTDTSAKRAATEAARIFLVKILPVKIYRPPLPAPASGAAFVQEYS